MNRAGPVLRIVAVAVWVATGVAAVAGVMSWDWAAFVAATAGLPFSIATMTASRRERARTPQS